MNGQHQPDPVEKRSRTKFWILLLSPASISLLILAIRYSGNLITQIDPRGFLGVPILIGMIVIWPLSSIYCGVWLAKSFCQPGVGRVLAGICLTIAVGAVNFFILLAGCAMGTW